MQLSPPPNFRIFSSLQKEMLYPLLPISLLLQPVSEINLLSVSIDMPVLNISYKGHHEINMWLLWLVSHIFLNLGTALAFWFPREYVGAFQRPLQTSHSLVFPLKCFGQSVSLPKVTMMLNSYHRLFSTSTLRIEMFVKRKLWVKSSKDKCWAWILFRELLDKLNGDSSLETAFWEASFFPLHFLLVCWFSQLPGLWSHWFSRLLWTWGEGDVNRASWNATKFLVLTVIPPFFWKQMFL